MVLIDNLWPTQIGSGKFDTTGLVEHIFTHHNMSNPPNDLSGYNILDDDNSEVMNNFKSIAYNCFDSYLTKTIGRPISDWNNYSLKGWLTGQGKHYSMAKHNHAGCQLSGVFYILAEDQTSGGEIVFSDPRSNCNRGYDPYFKPMFDNHIHAPKTGDFMIFPSFTYHAVNPFFSELRICMPVDLFLNRQ